MSSPNPKSSAFWSPVGVPSRKGRKVRADAVLKNLCPAAHEQIVAWANQPVETDPDGKPIKGTGGVLFACTQLAEIAREFSLPALRVSGATLYEFLDWWRLEQDLEISLDREEQVLAKTGNKKLAREAGETLLMRLGIAKQDSKLIQAAALVSDSRRSLDLQEESGKTKARQKDVQLALATKNLALAERRVVLLEANAAKAKETLEAVAKKGGLSPEALKQIEEAAKLL
ncbi:MAG: hypothetical protein P4L99_21725 [Chthoniobacter sp.]|nr:hypothetical protein [Chthoniobacter sp.]